MVMKAIVCISLLVAAAVAISSIDPELEKFMQFMNKYNKVYDTPEEFDRRFATFKQNLALSEEFNSKDPFATYGVTKFSDLSPEEFQSTHLMPVHSKPTPADNMYLSPNTLRSIPASYDWRTKGAVTPVKNQGQCGSCWAFSTTEEIESQWFLAGHKLVGLSEQQIVDCDTNDDGCGGGDTPTAYQYVIQAGGLELETEYPYVGNQTSYCHAKTSGFAASIKGWKYACKDNNETEMAANLATYGPLSICVDASTWPNYNGGIITSNCANSLDHCVQLVGFGTSSSGVPYWLVRNSWGTDWGEDGYLRVERGHNLCGISDEVTLALVDGPSTTGGSGPSSSASASSSGSVSSKLF